MQRESELLALLGRKEEEIRQLRAMLVPRIEFPREWKLQPAETKILRHLFGVAPRRCSKQEIKDMLYWRRDEQPESGLETRVAKIRAKLRPFGIIISSQRGMGYWLNEKDADLIRSFLPA